MHKAGNISTALNSIRGGSQWLLDSLEKASAHERPMLLMIIWRNWQVRNDIIHGKPASPVEASMRFLESYISTLLQISHNPNANLQKGKQNICLFKQNPTPYQSVHSVPLHWEKPPAGWMKLNIDGSFQAEDENGGVGMILRNWSGEVIFSSCRFLNSCREALESELLACVEGLRLALQWTILPIIIETDCLVAFQLVQVKVQDRSALAHIISEIKWLMDDEREVVIQKINRSQNQVSHMLAHKARSEHLSKFWLGNSCSLIFQYLYKDLLVE